MGVMDKFLNYMKLNDEDDEYFDDDDYIDDEPEEAKPRKQTSSVNDYSAPAEEKKPSKITPMKPRKMINGNGMEVCVIKPTTVEDAREILRHYLPTEL